MFSFAFAHLDQIGKRCSKGLLYCRPRLRCVDAFLSESHHTRRLQNCADGNFAGRAELGLKGAHRIVIGARQGGVEGQLAIAIRTLFA